MYKKILGTVSELKENISGAINEIPVEGHDATSKISDDVYFHNIHTRYGIQIFYNSLTKNLHIHVWCGPALSK